MVVVIHLELYSIQMANQYVRISLRTHHRIKQNAKLRYATMESHTIPSERVDMVCAIFRAAIVRIASADMMRMLWRPSEINMVRAFQMCDEIRTIS